MKLHHADPRSRETSEHPRLNQTRWLPLAGLWLCLAVLCAGIGLLITPLLAQQAPGLTLTQTSSNQFQLTLTNAVAGETYVIYRRTVLGDINYPWQFHLLGTPGQTNFTIDMGIYGMGFLQSISGTNWDSDSAVNWVDANPLDPNVGILSITIDSPANGTNIQ